MSEYFRKQFKKLVPLLYFKHFFFLTQVPLTPTITLRGYYRKRHHIRESQRKILDKQKQSGKEVTFLMHKAGYISKNLHAFPFPPPSCSFSLFFFLLSYISCVLHTGKENISEYSVCQIFYSPFYLKVVPPNCVQFHLNLY